MGALARSEVRMLTACPSGRETPLTAMQQSKPDSYAASCSHPRNARAPAEEEARQCRRRGHLCAPCRWGAALDEGWPPIGMVRQDRPDFCIAEPLGPRTPCVSTTRGDAWYRSGDSRVGFPTGSPSCDNGRPSSSKPRASMLGRGVAEEVPVAGWRHPVKKSAAVSLYPLRSW